MHTQVQLLRTGIQPFLSACTSEPTQECFECSVSSCYSAKMSLALSSGVFAAGDVMEECEMAAAQHCRLDVAQELNDTDEA